MIYTLDTEFNAGDANSAGKLISLALVAEDGRSIYLGLNKDAWGNVDLWVQANVMPILDKAFIPIKWVTNAEAALAIEDFLAGDNAVHIVADWPIDHGYFSQTIITGPGTMIDLPGYTTEVYRCEPYPTKLEHAVQHNAWWDAKALMLTYNERLK
jgi:hypothetical protein